MTSHSLISKVGELTPLSNEAIHWLSLNKETFVFKKNEILLSEKRLCNYLYFVCKGVLGGFYHNQQKEVCNWLAAEGDFATSYYSFITRQASYETIECYENAVVEAISHQHLMKMYQLFPETERAGRLILEDYYARLEERLMAIQFKTAQQRYLQFVEKRSDLAYRAPLGRIATYLGMKPETLSRIRASV